jgi:hypothetical protein
MRWPFFAFSFFFGSVSVRLSKNSFLRTPTVDKKLNRNSALSSPFILNRNYALASQNIQRVEGLTLTHVVNHVSFHVCVMSSIVTLVE